MSNLASAVVGEFAIALDGTDLKGEDLRNVIRIEVERGIRQPDRCEIVMADPNWVWAGDKRPAFGAKVDVRVPYEGDEITLIKEGRVGRCDVSQERGEGSFLHIVAYGPRYMLQKVQRAEAFSDAQVGVTMGDVSKTSGLKADSGDTPTRPYLLQANVANKALIEEFAARTGLVISEEGPDLNLQPPKLEDSGIKLTYGLDVIQMRVEVNTLPPLAKVKGSAHDFSQKGQWTSEASSYTGKATGWDKAGTDIVKEKFGEQVYELADLPVKSQGELDKMVQAYYDEKAYQFVKAEAVALGVPTIPVASVIEIEKLGKKLSGAWYVTKVVHRLDREAGYSVFFEACRPALGSG